MSEILVLLAATGWFAYWIERDSTRFHKQMADFWYERSKWATEYVLRSRQSPPSREDAR